MDSFRHTATTALLIPCAFAVVLALAAGCADSADQKWYAEVSDPDFDEDTLSRINEHRASKDLGELTFDESLYDLAFEHADDMDDRDDLNHDGFESRASDSGSVLCVENVAAGAETAERVFEIWRDSPGHNENLLHPAIRRAAVAHDGAYSIFFACY